MNTFFSTSFYLLCGLAGIVLLITSVIYFAGKQLVNNPTDARLFQSLIAILGISIALQFPGRAFRGLLVSHLRYDLNSAVTIVRSILRLPVVLIVLNSGFGLIGLAAASATLEILSMIVIVVMAFRVHRSLVISPRLFEKEKAREIIRYGLHTMVAQTADICLSSGSAHL